MYTVPSTIYPPKSELQPEKGCHVKKNYYFMSYKLPFHTLLKVPVVGTVSAVWHKRYLSKQGTSGMVVQHSGVPLRSRQNFRRDREFIEYESRQNNRPFTRSDFINGKIANKDITELFYSRLSGHLPDTYTDREGTVWTFASCCDCVGVKYRVRVR